MVVIIPIRAPDMQRDVRRLRETVQAMRDHLRAQITDLLAPETDVDHGPGARGEVDDGPREGFVEGSVAAAEAGD